MLDCQRVQVMSTYCLPRPVFVETRWNIGTSTMKTNGKSHGFPYRYHIETTISINLPDTKECFRTICDGEIHGKSWQQLHTATPDLKLHVFSLDAQGKLGSLRLKKLKSKYLISLIESYWWDHRCYGQFNKLISRSLVSPQQQRLIKGWFFHGES